MIRTLCTWGLAGLLAVAALAVSDAQAQSPAKKKKRGKRAQRDIAAMFERRFEKAGLTDEQKKEIRTIVQEYQSKLGKLRAAMKLTAEQRQARRKAAADAKASGLSGKELRERIQKAVSLTEEQKKAQAEFRALMREIQQKVRAVLTAEQRAKLRPAKKNRPKRKKNRKKENAST